MILVESITIEEFRGIRKRTLNFKGKNFVVCGPNGTGKSGVVDALEFGLTGNISRLSGRGTGEITLKDHAPHVDSRDNPEKAKVTLNLIIPSLNNKSVTIERNVKEALNPKITPNTNEVIEIFKQLEDHPEFVLSRRELITYVLATPGNRSEEVQALLRLDQVGKLRSIFKTMLNSYGREAVDFKKVFAQTQDNLAQALEITELTTDKLLEAVNLRRAILGLSHIETLTNVTSLCDGLETSTKLVTPLKVDKRQALFDIKNFQELVEKLYTTEMNSKYNDLKDKILELSKNHGATENISREKFLRTAITLITEDSCPVCDTKWDIATLKEFIEKKLEKFDEATKIRISLEKILMPVVNILEEINDALESLEKYAKILAYEQIVPLQKYRLFLETKKNHFKNFFPLADTMSSLNDFLSVPAEIIIAVSAIETVIIKIPEPTQQETARDYLMRCQDRLETYREAGRKTKKTEERFILIKKIYDEYVKTSNSVLEGVYREVEEEFGKLYRFINCDDEGDFTVNLTPSFGKLSFDVDFYGRGHFPPGAYHSEGHQDAMGLCLYLALMKRLQGEKFLFAVLDDVLMSVDTGHRRAVCSLLKEKFSQTQFILTTHDDVWLKHMVTIGLIRSENYVRFNNWTPDYGPSEWSNKDTWTEINRALEQDDVLRASGLLRNYLEYIFKEICGNLYARVEFKGDGRYELGDTLPSGVKAFREILLKAKIAAESWGNKDDVDVITAKEKKLMESFVASNANQWQINSVLHYNEWVNLSSKDFAPVVASFQTLVQNFFCENDECGSLFYLNVAPSKTRDTLKCSCGATNLNLKRKPTETV